MTEVMIRPSEAIDKIFKRLAEHRPFLQGVALASPEGYDFLKLEAVVRGELAINDRLRDTALKNSGSLARALAKCILVGLYPMHGDCWLIPRDIWTPGTKQKAPTVCFQDGAWGYVTRAKMLGIDLSAHVVKLLDFYEEETSPENVVRHKKWRPRTVAEIENPPENPVIGAYAKAVWYDKEAKKDRVEYFTMSVHEIHDDRDKALAAQSGLSVEAYRVEIKTKGGKRELPPAWRNNPDDMCRRAPLKKAVRLFRGDPKMLRLIQYGNEADLGVERPPLPELAEGTKTPRDTVAGYLDGLAGDGETMPEGIGAPAEGEGPEPEAPTSEGQAGDAARQEGSGHPLPMVASTEIPPQAAPLDDVPVSTPVNRATVLYDLERRWANVETDGKTPKARLKFRQEILAALGRLYWQDAKEDPEIDLLEPREEMLQEKFQALVTRLKFEAQEPPEESGANQAKPEQAKMF